MSTIENPPPLPDTPEALRYLTVPQLSLLLRARIHEALQGAPKTVVNAFTVFVFSGITGNWLSQADQPTLPPSQADMVTRLDLLSYLRDWSPSDFRSYFLEFAASAHRVLSGKSH